jgi:hypothetical protein
MACTWFSYNWFLFLLTHRCFLNVTGKKKKEQHDAQAGMGLNPAYAGAYGAAPPVSNFCLFGNHF